MQEHNLCFWMFKRLETIALARSLPKSVTISNMNSVRWSACNTNLQNVTWTQCGTVDNGSHLPAVQSSCLSWFKHPVSSIAATNRCSLFIVIYIWLIHHIYSSLQFCLRGHIWSSHRDSETVEATARTLPELSQIGVLRFDCLCRRLRFWVLGSLSQPHEVSESLNLGSTGSSPRGLCR